MAACVRPPRRVDHPRAPRRSRAVQAKQPPTLDPDGSRREARAWRGLRPRTPRGTRSMYLLRRVDGALPGISVAIHSPNTPNTHRHPPTHTDTHHTHQHTQHTQGDEVSGRSLSSWLAERGADISTVVRAQGHIPFSHLKSLGWSITDGASIRAKTPFGSFIIGGSATSTYHLRCLRRVPKAPFKLQLLCTVVSSLWIAGSSFSLAIVLPVSQHGYGSLLSGFAWALAVGTSLAHLAAFWTPAILCTLRIGESPHYPNVQKKWQVDGYHLPVIVLHALGILAVVATVSIGTIGCAGLWLSWSGFTFPHGHFDLKTIPHVHRGWAVGLLSMNSVWAVGETQMCFAAMIHMWSRGRRRRSASLMLRPESPNAKLLELPLDPSDQARLRKSLVEEAPGDVLSRRSFFSRELWI